MMIRILVIVILLCSDCFASDTTFKRNDDYWRNMQQQVKQQCDKKNADGYWKQIQRITADEFGGWNAEVKIHTAYNFESSESSSTGKGVGIGLSMPIYSKQQKIASRIAARDFSEHGSRLVREYKESIAHIGVIFEECQYMESIIAEYGVEAVKASYDCKRRLESQILVIEQKERDIRMVIDPFLKKYENIDVVKTGGQ